MEYSGFARSWDRVVFRGDHDSREFIAFWMIQDRVVAGNFTVNSLTQITATVQDNSSSGPITVVTPSGSATSSTSFMVNPAPGGIARVGEIGRVSNTSGLTVNQLSITVGPAGVAAGDEVVVGVGISQPAEHERGRRQPRLDLV